MVSQQDLIRSVRMGYIRQNTNDGFGMQQPDEFLFDLDWQSQPSV
jgi:hypothetical protein